ncbi:MAG: nucleoside triphosphate pyrophosphohydrolase [Candidatus Hatepunaea meridiana]|nr:nucleoside triphosphate pyrophosphohydrolase [Candidatus Hatepunaea meridiana]
MSPKKTIPTINVKSDPIKPGTLDAIAEVIHIMANLRAPNGCPWDIAQTRESLLPNLLEETYEFINAVQNKDIANMKEELGDLLLQVVFHAEIASERKEFDLGDVARELSDKLIRRHPHVFGDVKAGNEEEAYASWNDAKRKEGVKKTSLADIPPNMPALLRARKVVEKAGRVGFEWPIVKDALAKLEEEVGELREAIEEDDKAHIREELGDVLFMAACIGRYIHQCPELALQSTIEKFLSRFRYIEKKLAEEGLTPEDATLEKMDGYWDEAKGVERM